MKWIINRKKIEVLKSICIEIITIISILMMFIGGQIAWKLLAEKKSQWYEESVAYELTKDRFIAEKAGMIFALLAVIAILLVLAGIGMYIIIRGNILMQLKRECYYLKLFGYTNIRITGILFLDVLLDLFFSLAAVLPAGAALWGSFQKAEVFQTLMLLVESGEKPKHIIVPVIYMGIAFMALIQIIIRKKEGKNNEHNSRGKRNRKIIQK